VPVEMQCVVGQVDTGHQQIGHLAHLQALVPRTVLHVLLLVSHRPAPASGCCSHYSKADYPGTPRRDRRRSVSGRSSGRVDVRQVVFVGPLLRPYLCGHYSRIRQELLRGSAAGVTYVLAKRHALQQ
jgi:hypothetical protein